MEEKGETGEKGEVGQDGESAYQIAKRHGFEGGEEEWLEKGYAGIADVQEENKLYLRSSGKWVDTNFHYDDSGIRIDGGFMGEPVQHIDFLIPWRNLNFLDYPNP